MADPASANGAQAGTNKPVKQPPVRTHVVSPSNHPLEVPPTFSNRDASRQPNEGAGQTKLTENRRLQCQHPGCTASYARIEHLDRHVKTHDPSHSYRCDEVRSPPTPSPPRQGPACNSCADSLYSRDNSAASRSRERESTCATPLAFLQTRTDEFRLGSDVLQRHLKVSDWNSRFALLADERLNPLPQIHERDRNLDKQNGAPADGAGSNTTVRARGLNRVSRGE